MKENLEEKFKIADKVQPEASKNLTEKQELEQKLEQLKSEYNRSLGNVKDLEARSNQLLGMIIFCQNLLQNKK